MSKQKSKRKKQRDVTRCLRENTHLGDDFIVFNIANFSAGVIWAKTMTRVRPPWQIERVLVHGVAKRNIFVGAIGRDEQGNKIVTGTELVSSRCKGEEVIDIVREIAQQHLDEIGRFNSISSFYVCTSNLDWKWTDEKVMQFLETEKVFDTCITKREHTANIYIDMREHMAKTNFRKTQVGGTHYTKLEVQPIEIIKRCRITWEFGNAIKYLARHRYKNGVEDVRKAYDYIERALVDGYDNHRAIRVAGDTDDFRLFASQFDERTTRALLSLWEAYRVKPTAKNPKNWEQHMEVCLFDISDLCFKTYNEHIFQTNEG